ncbi:hypothetical protein WJX82_005029 [Trebouxia sp. C0006]
MVPSRCSQTYAICGQAKIMAARVLRILQIVGDEIAPAWAAAMTGHPDCLGLEQLIYVLWPTAVKLSPAQLQPVAASTVRCFIDKAYAVFWIPLSMKHLT